MVVSATLSAQGEVCAQGEVIAVQVPEHMLPGLRSEGEQDQPQDG